MQKWSAGGSDLRTDCMKDAALIAANTERAKAPTETEGASGARQRDSSSCATVVDETLVDERLVDERRTWKSLQCACDTM